MKTMQRGLGAALTAALLLGCGKKAATPASEKTLRRLEAPISTNNIGLPVLLIARELKYFEDEGLEVSLQTINTSGNIDQLVALSTGKIDLANTGGTSAPALYIEQGNDLVIIGATMGEGDALISLPENAGQYGEFTPQSLYGKRVGAVRASTGDVALRGWLAGQGADLAKIDFVELDSYATILEAVRKGSIDLGHAPTLWRPIAESQGLRAVLHVDTLVPHFPCCRVSTTSKLLAGRREDYVGFLKALIRAYKVFQEDHERTLAIAGNYYGQDRETLETNYYTYGHYTLSPDPERKRILEFYQSMTAVGYAKGTADMAAHIDVTLYRDALERLLGEYPAEPFYQAMKRQFEENN
jgi:NitT/TauT family transport system substrate-binding protein